MSRLRVRTRWADLLACQWPRYVIDGCIVHSDPSQLIRHAASKDAFRTLRRGGPQRKRLRWMIVLALGFLLPYLYFFFRLAFSGRVLNTIDLLDGWPAWSVTLVVVLAMGLILAMGVVGALMALEPLVIWGMRPHLRRAIYRVGAWWCLRCNYDLRGHDMRDRCPECGAERIVTRMEKP